MRLASPDPLAAPEITFGFLGSDYDMLAVRSAIKLAREIGAQPAMRPYVVEEIVPGPRVGSEGEPEGFVRQTGVTNHHPSSSCAMGTGSNSVVDPRLRVHGVGGLRVADASIMPSGVAGNTSGPWQRNESQLGDPAHRLDVVRHPRKSPRVGAICRAFRSVRRALVRN